MSVGYEFCVINMATSFAVLQGTKYSIEFVLIILGAVL